MKKFSLLPLVLVIPLFVGCDKVEKDNSLIFTEFLNGDSIQDRAVEITNISNKTVDLSNYKICNYRDGSGLDQPTEIIQLTGTLESQRSYVICYSSSCDEIKNHSNLVSHDLINDGTFSISLKYKDQFIVDTIGYVGAKFDIANHCDLVRKQEFFVPRGEKYVEYDWIRYPFDDFSHLGNTECISNEDLLKGPRLTQENIDTPFCVNNISGTGGAMLVSLVYTMDGDTTKFNFGNQYSAYDVSGSNSVRYYGINTPEIAHSSGEKSDLYGDEAQAYTNKAINRGKSFRVQSIKNGSLFETYGRILGYVWVSESTTPSLESYNLLSFYIVKNGYARVSFIDRRNHKADDLKYKGIFYEEYLFNAQNYAKINKLNIFSE